MEFTEKTCTLGSIYVESSYVSLSGKLQQGQVLSGKDECTSKVTEKVPVLPKKYTILNLLLHTQVRCERFIQFINSFSSFQSTLLSECAKPINALVAKRKKEICDFYVKRSWQCRLIGQKFTIRSKTESATSRPFVYKPI